MRTCGRRRPAETFSQEQLLIAQRDPLRSEGDERCIVGRVHVLAAGDGRSLGDLVPLDAGVEPLHFGVEFAEARLQRLGRCSGIRRDLAQPGPSHGISPRTADHGRAFVAGSRRPAFTTKRITGVVPPEASVVHDPRGGLVDHDRLPLASLSGTDRDAVTAGVVDVRDRQTGVFDVASPREEDVRDPTREPEQTGEGGYVAGREVLAGKVGAAVRTEAGEDDRMLTLDGQVGVVPASPVATHPPLRHLDSRERRVDEAQVVPGARVVGPELDEFVDGERSLRRGRKNSPSVKRSTGSKRRRSDTSSVYSVAPPPGTPTIRGTCSVRAI